ncbi:MAG: RagB/SusD family nutrient uptake outer membrane protein [Gemmatimonadota bacterium]|nr:RagB/SusD family nutrient uptake outer membrane protein [Gemmatimonadota bacterium]
MRAKWTNRNPRVVLAWMAGIGLLTAVACKDVLKVQDPQSFVTEKLDNPIIFPAVAAGVEGDFQLTIDDIAMFTGLMSDELTNTSTWRDWADIGEGVLRKNWATAGSYSNPQDRLLRARFAAQDAENRFTRVMGKDTVELNPLMVTVRVTEAWIDLELAMAYCESPPSPGVAAVSDQLMFQQAIKKFQTEMPLVQNAHLSASEKLAWINYVNAGLARAHLMVGNYDSALVHAQAVSAGFRKDAVFSANSAAQQNLLNQQGHQSQNRSGSLNVMWYSQLDTIAGFLRDTYSGKLDPRLPFTHDNNNSLKYDKGANGVTKFVSLGKAATAGAPIAITKKEEMNLIEAEVYWRKGQFQTAIDKMNLNRVAAGLPAFANPGTSDAVLTLLLQERFAVLFGEGHRMQDLNRFNLVKSRLGAGRISKLPLSYNEIVNNAAIGIGGGKCPDPIS